ncbi:MAG: galactofuranosyltransferase [Bacteroidaceae bacterium]|nr:galactofuranosyltransferase [Bacteroidaceae bacterium]
MRRCYISRNYKNPGTANGKAKMDIEDIMQGMGFKNIGLTRSTHKNKVLDFILTLSGIIKALCLLRPNDILVLQYPMKKYYEMVCNVAHRRGAKVITLIHDLGSFRRKKLTVAQEIRRLHHSDVIIVHNEHMKHWLEQQGCQRPLVVLGIFDYLSAQVPLAENGSASTQKDAAAQPPYSLSFVGNLSYRQNSFLYELGKHMTHSQLYLYGNRYEEEKGSPAFHYMGFTIDTDLIQHNMGDFGLSWYGNSLEEGVGDLGEYMNFNNPHKVSLYLRCHTPVILHTAAGLAAFVKEKGIGICVDSLTDLEGRLTEVSAEEYSQMRENVKRIALQLADGHYTRTAIEAAIAQLLNS